MPKQTHFPYVCVCASMRACARERERSPELYPWDPCFYSRTHAHRRSTSFGYAYADVCVSTYNVSAHALARVCVCVEGTAEAGFHICAQAREASNLVFRLCAACVCGQHAASSHRAPPQKPTRKPAIPGAGNLSYGPVCVCVCVLAWRWLVDMNALGRRVCLSDILWATASVRGFSHKINILLCIHTLRDRRRIFPPPPVRCRPVRTADDRRLIDGSTALRSDTGHARIRFSSF